MKEINIIAGYKGAGKSTVIEIINTFGFYTTELSIQWKYLEKRGFDRNEKFGEWDVGVVSLFYDNCLTKMPDIPVFVSGFSRPSEIDYLENKGLYCRVVSLQTEKQFRYERMLKRKRPGEEHLRIEDLELRDLRRLGNVENYETNDLLGLLVLAEYRLTNNGSLLQLCKDVEGMLKHFGDLK